jgi:hypothetical protein
LVRRSEEVPAKLAMQSCSLVIVTNLELPPSDAVAVVPTVRDYPVLFLKGHVDSLIESTCATKNIPIREVPIDGEALRREFRLALDDPGACATRLVAPRALRPSADTRRRPVGRA